LDSNYQVMLWFATADRMIAQQKYDSAFVLFDSIQTTFPYHALADEILFRKAMAMEQRGEWQRAIGYYEDLLKLHGQDILADDALLSLGRNSRTKTARQSNGRNTLQAFITGI